MLESITLRNFQVHRKLTVDFGPGVTTIIGDSDLGKSTIIRAIRWVCLNQPDGKGMVNWGAKTAKVSLMVDGQTIVRKRSKKGAANLYLLDGKKFAAFGKSVPSEILQLVNVDSINFQGQFDSPFWFSLSAGQISRELNAIVNLGVIDKALSAAAANLRKVRSVVEVTEQRLKEARLEKKDLAWVPALDQQYQGVEAVAAQVQRVKDKAAGLRCLVRDAKQYRQVIETRRIVVTAGRVAMLAGDRVAQVKQQAQDLRDLTDQIDTAKRRLARKVPSLYKVDQLWERLQSIAGKKHKLLYLVKDIENTRERVERTKKDSKASRDRLLSHAQQVCPLCKRPLD